MFDVILQIGAVAVHRSLNEMRKAALPVLPSSIGAGAPIPLDATTTVDPLISIPDQDFPVSLNEDDQTVEIQITGLELQLLVSGSVPGDVLYESAASCLLSLPLGMQTSDLTVSVGFDPEDFNNATALVSLENGHPLADNDVFIRLVDRAIRAIFSGPGYSPVFDQRNIPAADGLQVDLWVGFNDSIRTPTDLSARIGASPTGPNFIRLRVPFEFEISLHAPGSAIILASRKGLEEIVADIPFSRSLDPGGPTGQVTIRTGEADSVLEHVEGDDLRTNPNWPLFESTVLSSFEALLTRTGDPIVIPVPSLEWILDRMRTLLRNGLSRDRNGDGAPDFIPIWQSTRPAAEAGEDEAPPVARAAIIGQTITIGMNGTLADSLDGVTAFIPAGRDFAMRLAPEPLLGEISAFLRAREEYDDASGVLSLAADAAAGATEIVLRGFAAETASIRARTRLLIGGFYYFVAADAPIAHLPDEEDASEDDEDVLEGNDLNQCTVRLETGLVSDLLTGQLVFVEFGFGLPKRLNGDGGDVRINDDLTPSLVDGRLRLSGTGRAIIPVIPDFNVALRMDFGLRWLSTARVRGDDQTGDQLVVETLDGSTDLPLVTGFPEGSLLRIDDDRTLYGLTEAAGNSENETLSLSRPLDGPHAHNDMVSLLWTPIGVVAGDTQDGATLRIAEMTHDEDSIPAGTRVTINGEAFRLDAPAEITTDVTGVHVTTLTLNKRLDSVLSEPPATNTVAVFSDGWRGTGLVFGPQFSETLPLNNVARRVPAGDELRISGMNGTFKVFNPRDDDDEREPDAVVRDRAATVSLRHPATDDIRRQFPELVTGGLLWDVLGQPAAGATVWRRTGPTRSNLYSIGDPVVNPDGPFDDLIGFLAGLIGAAFFGGTPVQLLAGVITGVVTRQLFGRLVQTIGAGRDIKFDDLELPIDDNLDGLGVYLGVFLNNPIEISPEGLLIAGQLNPASSYPEVLESRVRTDGPFAFQAAAPGQLTANAPIPRNSYSWQTGDGDTLAAAAPEHSYLRAGIYVASLSGTDTQLGVPRRSRHFAEVRVENRPPVLAPLPQLNGFEGDEIALNADFTDAAYADAHRAIVSWGDGTLPEIVAVDEVLGPPMTHGRITARHRYCDNGVFPVTVVVEDERGGTDRRETRAIIENLPPEVEAGPDVFAHPCVPTRFVGHFTDPGWCDTHKAVWDFGDCTPPFPATIDETHTAPEGRGTATATHCYTGCGTWQARLTVTDDDGASATDTLIVTHSNLRNGAFEEGFAETLDGKVARHWQGYARPQSSIVPPGEVFDCESCITFDGGTSQSIRAEGYYHAGLRQSFGTNIGWEYQVSVRLTVRGEGATGWIGLDPLGGTDRAAPSIVWRSLAQADGWQAVSCRTVAEARQVTVFVEFRTPQAHQLLIDAVEMQAYPCVPSDLPDVPQEPEPKRNCIDLHKLTQTNPPGATVQDLDGFILSYASGLPLDLVTFGPPVGASKVRVPARSASDHLNVELPAPTEFAEALVWGSPSDRIEMRAFGAESLLLAETSSDIGDLQTLVIQHDGIERLEISAGQSGALHMVCIGAADTPKYKENNRYHPCISRQKT